jgi:hypothetical protein
VLPFKGKNKKLLFPLCGICGEYQLRDCSHSDEERSLIETYVSEELKLAVSKGYEIIEFYEVLHYPNKSMDLFKGYVGDWCKIKTEASGWAEGCVSDEQKQEFVRGYKENEGIDLDPNNIKLNPGYRSMAKLLLNSLYGKLGQRPDLIKTKICHNYLESNEILENEEKYEVLGEEWLDKVTIINYRDKTNTKVGNTSVAIAAFVTANARIKLYKLLDKLETLSAGCVLYFDTDSVIFVLRNKEHLKDLNIGGYLGQLKDEIKGDYGSDAKIEEFYSWGPKMYRLIISTKDGQKEEHKFKGIKQNLATNQIFDLETFKLTVENKIQNLPSDELKVPQNIFRRRNHEVWTEEIKKQIRLTSDKRINIIDENRTVPYGYKDYTDDDFARLMTD